MALTKVSTPAIKDEAITLAKLLHGDSNSNGKFLRANNGADPTFETIDLTALSASNLTSGTLPDARFPATLPAASAANLTNIPAANITGALPAIDGSNLTGISAGVSVGNAGDERVITSDGTNLDAESLFVYKASNNTVGIGLASPNPTASYYEGACLHIHQAASGSNAGSQLHLTNAYGGSGAGDGTQVSHYSNSLYINNQENGDTYFYNNGSPNLTIKASGNVGIGTQSPTDKLHVNGTALIGSNLYLNNITYIAANKGIYFNGGSNETNYLDEYEEGTFTPTARGHSSNSSPVIEGSGKYTRVGRLVQVTLSFSAENGSYMPSNQYFQIHGLPFIADGTHYMPYPGFNYKVVFNTSDHYLFYMPNNGTILWGYRNISDQSYQPWSTNDWDNVQWYHNNTFTYMTDT